MERTMGHSTNGRLLRPLVRRDARSSFSSAFPLDFRCTPSSAEALLGALPSDVLDTEVVSLVCCSNAARRLDIPTAGDAGVVFRPSPFPRLPFGGRSLSERDCW